MSIIASIAKVLLQFDAKVQIKLADFWYNRASSMRTSAQASIRQADIALTGELTKIEADHKHEVARVVRQLNERKDDNIDKAHARRDFDVIDAQEYLDIANTLSDTALDCVDKHGRAADALRALGDGV